MTITFLELYNECAGQPWSMFDNDAASEDDFESSMKISINKAVSFLWNYQPWFFRLETTKFNTKNNVSEYDAPDGNILKKTISGVNKYNVVYNKKYLEYADDYDLLDEKSGEPEQFYLEGDTLYIYPTPDNKYEIKIKYLSQYFASDNSGNNIYELSNDDDVLNVPEKYEVLFKNCVISKAMMYAIADENDENYSGYKEQYNDALSILTDYCKNSLVDRNIVF